ncbi:hypothetical protein [Paracidovorax oryzae]|uniref:hypothetical protein n=1 Tax=Paracidovorax oryzae TaxID=862720 RepID=UPI00047D7B58|nr:hypothetical protein [Paracidovorax oryzae]
MSKERQAGGRWARIGTVLLEGVQAFAGGGALLSVPVALAMGKVALAVVLGLAGIGICVRLARHRRAAAGRAPTVPQELRAALTAAAAVLAVAETALLAEATGLPVRYGQPGFAPSNWAWVLAALAVLFWGQRNLLLGWARGRRNAVAGAAR